MQHKKKTIEWAATKLMGHKHWCRDWLAALLAADADLLGHILEQDSGYLHYLCLINMGSDRLHYDDQKELAGMIRHTPRKQMLKAVLDPCPDGLSGVLKRLHKRPMSRSSYTRFLNLIHDSKARKFLSNGNGASHSQLQFLEKLPSELRDCPVIMDIKDKIEMDIFLEMIDEVHCLAPAMSYADMALSLRHVSPSRPGNFFHNRPFSTWYKKQLSKKTFPAPPWPGNNWAKPVTSGPQLRHVARTMRNCIAGEYFLKNILDGNDYFYVTNQKPYIVMLLNKFGDDKWRLGAVDGEAHKELDKKSVTHILHKLQKEGFSTLDDRLPRTYEDEDEDDMPDMDFPDDCSFEDEVDFYERQTGIISFTDE